MFVDTPCQFPFLAGGGSGPGGGMTTPTTAPTSQDATYR